MSTKDILTLSIGTLGAAVALATLVAACLEYVRQGKMARVRMFFDLRGRLKDTELRRVAELIDEAAAPDPKVSERAERQLAKTPLRVKRDYLGLFEEVSLAMEWGLIEPEVAHYMFGYYALHCADCRAFWVGVGQWNPYWDRFYTFCDRMEIERKAFEKRRSEMSFGRGAYPASAVENDQVDRSMPRVVVRLPPVLRSCVEGRLEVEARGNTVGQVLADLVDVFPDLKWQIFSGENGFDSDSLALNRYVNVFRNDEEVRVLDDLETLVEEGDSIVLLPALAGG